MRIVIFGGGMQGKVIAQNLAKRTERPEVIIADVNECKDLGHQIQFQKANVLDKAQVASAVKNADAAVLAVPSSIAHEALENLIETGVAVADVSFTPDPPLSLDALAKKTGSCCLVDCGIAPGLSHMMVGSAYAELGGLDRARILVGGIPQSPPEVFHHAIYFNPCDLIAEYIRPARARERGKEIAPHPFDAHVEKYEDSELGHLQAFLSDGLRSLLTSYPDVPDMVERTLRWPGHFDTMRVLFKTGLFEPDTISNTAAAMNKKFGADRYPDLLLMVVEAQRGGKTRSWRLLDHCRDGNSAMSRTTGFTTAAVAMLLAGKKFTTPGVHPPEHLGHVSGLVDAVINDLSERGVVARALATT